MRYRLSNSLGRRAGMDALRHEGGAAAIETALTYMLLMTCVLGIIECCMMVYGYSVYADAARVGVRYAVFHGSYSSSSSGPGCTDTTGANVRSAVTTYASEFTNPVGAPTVTVSYPDSSCTAPARVQVQINYTYHPLFHFPGTTVGFQASSAGRIIY